MRPLLALALAGCGSDVDRILDLEGDPVAGEEIYAARCALCHGDDGAGGTGPSLVEESEEEAELVEVILVGEGDMSGLREQLSDQEVADCVAFVQSLTGGA